ncbi:MAG: SPASM domain-containing protein [Patescibacteria group bacterium]
MCRILDIWLGIGDTSWRIEHVSSYLDALRGPVSSCEFANECHRFLTIEQNGDVAGCDFVDWRPILGNVLQADLPTICQGEVYHQWRERVVAVPPECRGCRWFSVCGGGCLHYRPYGADDGIWGRYQLCQVRQRIWEYYAERVVK